MMGDWTFFSNYGHVLVCLARDREVRLRDVAQEVGITERAVQKIVRDMQDEGFLLISKQGRCNRYQINRRKALRHKLESHCTVGKLLALTARNQVATQPLQVEEESGQAQVKSDGAGKKPARAEKPVREEKPVKKEKPVRKEKPEKQVSPVDTRQQGSLF